MPKFRIFWRRLYWTTFYLLPAALFFSYYPIISLGSNASMNFELSIALLWLVLFDIVAFVSLIFLAKPKLSSLSDRRFFLFALFPLYLTISVFWSLNPLRGLLTAGIAWLIFFAVFAIIYVSPLLSPPCRLKRYFLIALFASTIFVCLFCFLQSILDTCGLPRESTLLCAGCTYRSFGFPHPSGFAIEPQFMGNLLLAPALTALYLFIYHRPKRQSARVLLLIICLISSTTLFFTFSRGAIYAYLVALLVLAIFALVRRVFRPTLVLIPLCSLLLSLGLQGAFAAIGPTSETFSSAISKSIHQLSLGLIDFRPSSSASTPDSSQEALEAVLPSDPSSFQALPESAPDALLDTSSGNSQPSSPYFDGYVAESTNVRLNLNRAAINTWLSTPNHILFGVGLGGAGTALYLNSAATGITSPKEIVQNEPLSLLLELGIIGITIAIFSLLLAFAPQIFPDRFLDGRAAPVKSIKSSSKSAAHARTSTVAPPQGTFWSHPALPLLLALIVAYLITLQFFSGLPNALQIYLLPPLLYLIFNRQNPLISAIYIAKSQNSHKNY